MELQKTEVEREYLLSLFLKKVKENLLKERIIIRTADWYKNGRRECLRAGIKEEEIREAESKIYNRLRPTIYQILEIKVSSNSRRGLCPTCGSKAGEKPLADVTMPNGKFIQDVSCCDCLMESALLQSRIFSSIGYPYIPCTDYRFVAKD